RAGSAAARLAGAPGRGGSRAAADPAPHHQRWLVDGGAVERAVGALPGVVARAAIAVAGAGGAVRGLCLVAALVAAGRGAGAGAELLAPAARGRSRGAGPAAGPAAAGGAERARRKPRGAPGRRALGGAVATGPAVGREPVHGGAGGISGPAVASVGPGGRQRGQPGRGPYAYRDGAADRVLCQHAGAAGGSVAGSDVRGAGGAGTGDGARGARAPGRAVREAGGRAASGAQPELHAAVPGDAGAAEHVPERGGRGRARPAAAGVREPDVEVRAVAGPDGDPARPSGRGGVLDGPVRRHDDDAAAGSALALAGVGGGEPGGPSLGAFAVGGGGEGAGARGVERHGSVTRNGVPARADLGVGAAASGGDGAGGGERASDLRRADAPRG